MVSSEEDRTESGPLSTDATTFIRYAFKNEGSVVTRVILIEIRVDGVVVLQEEVGGAQEGVVRTDLWPGLLESAGLDPGEHTVRFVVDPENAISELDESNNAYEATFTWGSGPLP